MASWLLPISATLTETLAHVNGSSASMSKDMMLPDANSGWLGVGDALSSSLNSLQNRKQKLQYAKSTMNVLQCRTVRRHKDSGIL